MGAKGDRHIRAVSAVPVALCLAQRGDEAIVDTQDRVNQRRMYPEKQRWILGRIWGAAGEASACGRQRSMNATMNRAYCVEGLGPLTLVAEGNREHRVDSVVEPRQRRDRTASERAVV